VLMRVIADSATFAAAAQKRSRPRSRAKDAV